VLIPPSFKINSRNKGNLDKRELSLKMEKLSISSAYRLGAMQIWSTLFPSCKFSGLVLVAGCGTGDLIAEFANSHPRVQFVGMDFSEAFYENAREHAKTTNIDWICDEVTNRPF